MIGPLPSPRHELFAQAVASGMSASKSYALAGNCSAWRGLLVAPILMRRSGRNCRMR